MADSIVVEVEQRSDLGKNAAGRLRRAGKVPGIVYGLDRAPFAVTVNPKRLAEVLKLETGKNTILNLSLAGQERTRAVMIREIQRDPVTEAPVHVDFVRVDLEKAIHVAVPIRRRDRDDQRIGRDLRRITAPKTDIHDSYLPVDRPSSRSAIVAWSGVSGAI